MSAAHVGELVDEVGGTREIPIQFTLPFDSLFEQQRIEFTPTQMPEIDNLGSGSHWIAQCCHSKSISTGSSIVLQSSIVDIEGISVGVCQLQDSCRIPRVLYYQTEPE